MAAAVVSVAKPMERFAMVEVLYVSQFMAYDVANQVFRIQHKYAAQIYIPVAGAISKRLLAVRY